MIITAAFSNAIGAFLTYKAYSPRAERREH